MVTYQEYLNNKYPNKDAEFFEYEYWGGKSMKQRLDGGELILIDWPKLKYVSFGKRLKLSTNWLTKLEIVNCPNITHVNLCHNELSNLDLSHLPNLSHLFLEKNKLTSCEFLDSLPNPEKLLILDIRDNNIWPTDIEIFSKFVNIEILRIGTTKIGPRTKKHNKFFGSLKSFQNLTKLKEIEVKNIDIKELPTNISIIFTNNVKKKFGEPRHLSNFYWDK